MKVFLVAVVALMAIAAVSADCGCLKCSKNLYVASPPTSPVQVIYRGAACSCNRQIPYTVEQPIVQPKPSVTLRDSIYRCLPLKVVKKVTQVPLYSYDYQVQVPVPEASKCNKCLVGLVAQTDRVVLPAPTCREPAPSVPSRGPVFEALSNVEDEDYVYQYPIKKCSCGRYNKSPSGLSITSRYHDGFRELTEQELEDNVDRNIRDIFFEDTLQGRLRRFFFQGLSSLEMFKQDEEAAKAVSLGRVKFLSRKKRSLPFRAPQRQGESSVGEVEDGREVKASGSRTKRSLDDLPYTFEDGFEDSGNEIPHGHDESYEDLKSSEEEDFEDGRQEEEEEVLQVVHTPKASNLLLETLHLDQLFPHVPLLFFVNAPISMLAQFHRINKHFEPVVQSVPTVIRTSGKYFTDFGEKCKRSFYVFTNCLMSSMDHFGGRVRRNVKEGFEVLKCQVNQDGSVDIVLFNHKSDTKLKDIALVIENFTMDAKQVEDMKMYFAKVDTTNLIRDHDEKKLNKKEKKMKEKSEVKNRVRRDIFEVDLNGDIQDLIKEKWGHLIEEQQHIDHPSAEVIFEEHFNQIPKLYDALKQSKKTQGKQTLSKKKTSKTRSDPILGGVASSFSGKKKKHEDFADLHPEKNLDIIKQEISTVLARLQNLLQADIDKDLKFYEDLVKLQYLKNTLVIDWRKHLQGDEGQVVSAKMNILNYIKELERFRASLTKKNLQLLMSQDGDAYNRSDLIKFLVELYKLQMIFKRIHEDLNDKIKLGSRFNHQNEDTFITQLEKIKFLEKTNKFELEDRLKAMRDSQVENNMTFLEKLRKLSELDESIEMEHDDREEVHKVARMIKENAHYKQEELLQAKEISSKVKVNQTYRKELKNLWDLERHILDNEDRLMDICKGVNDAIEEVEEVDEEDEDKEENDEDSLDKFDLLKMAKPITLKPLDLKDLKDLVELKPNLEWEKDMKSKMDEFVKDIEEKRKSWVKKTKKLAEIMKEP